MEYGHGNFSRTSRTTMPEQIYSTRPPSTIFLKGTNLQNPLALLLNRMMPSLRRREWYSMISERVLFPIISAFHSLLNVAHTWEYNSPVIPTPSRNSSLHFKLLYPMAVAISSLIALLLPSFSPFDMNQMFSAPPIKLVCKFQATSRILRCICTYRSNVWIFYMRLGKVLVSRLRRIAIGTEHTR
jgi:hypothetical protein